MKIARVPSITAVAAALLAVLAWSSAANAVTDRLTLECKDGGAEREDFTATATFQYTKDNNPLGAPYELPCQDSNRSQIFVTRPAGANDFHIDVTVCEEEEECTNCTLDGVIGPHATPRAILECRLDSDARSPRAFFKLNR